jgi:hypothetical protein
MNLAKQVEILLVEDNPRDAELTIRVLRKHNLARKRWIGYSASKPMRTSSRRTTPRLSCST